MSESVPDVGLDPARWSGLRDGVRRRVARIAPDAADDITQDVLLKIHQRVGQLRDAARLEAWVGRIADRAAIDHLRRRRPEVGLPPGLAAPEPDADRDIEPLSRWAATQIDSLPEPYRSAVRRVDLGGETQRAVADSLGISYSGLKSRVQRGRSMLREAVLRCCQVELDTTGRITEFQSRKKNCDGTCACE